MKKIVVLFSISGLSELNKKFDVLIHRKNDLEDMFIKQSLTYIQDRAIHYVNATTGGSEWYQVTGTLANSFVIDMSLKRLFSSCYYSAFVEFGTGIKGESRDGYESNASGKGEDGWFFVDDDGILRFTHGMPAHRYMFNAVRDYVTGNEYKRIFKRCFESMLEGI